MKIHLLGPSGSGTSTIGKALAELLNISFFESDDIFWEESALPFSKKRPLKERTRILNTMLESSATWVLSGSALEWGDILLESADRIILLYAPWEIRRKRLIARERERFGALVAPGGEMEEIHQAFLKWAGQYDKGGMDMRSRASEKAWTEKAACSVLTLENIDLDSTIFQILQWMEQEGTPELDPYL